MSQMPWIKPMRARDLLDDALLDDPSYACEEKCDGIRVKIQFDAGRVVSVMSRNRKPVEGPGLEWLMSLDAHGLTADVDGELFVQGGVSSDVAHHLAAGLPVEIALFDVLILNEQEVWRLPYSVRREIVRFVADQLASPMIRMAKSFPFARQAFEDVKAGGGEGVMLKRIDACYEPGIESWAWQKVKVTKDVDVIITGCDGKPTRWTVRPGHVGTDGILYPAGKSSTTYLAGVCGLEYGFWSYSDQKAYRVGTLGVTGPKEDLQRFVGAVAVVKYYGLGASGALRHPQFSHFRCDKEPCQCLPPSR